MKDSKNLVIGLLCAVVCIMAVAYAAFATTLNVNGTATIASNWDVHISNISCKATPVEGGTTDAEAVTKSFGATTAQFNMKFFQPGDSAECVVTITNSGTLDAKVSTIETIITDANNNTNKTDETLTLESDAIRYNLSGIVEGTTLAAGQTNTYTISAEFFDVANGQTPSEDQLSKTVTVNVTYEQDLA
ncbi:MAG: hypothetical protein IJO43_04240 [Bacilli bacterium]|nr:hypothetical protein [Bacilli bacterium]